MRSELFRWSACSPRHTLHAAITRPVLARPDPPACSFLMRQCRLLGGFLAECDAARAYDLACIAEHGAAGPCCSSTSSADVAPAAWHPALCPLAAVPLCASSADLQHFLQVLHTHWLCLLVLSAGSLCGACICAGSCWRPSMFSCWAFWLHHPCALTIAWCNADACDVCRRRCHHQFPAFQLRR